jgi:hypothetical protein
MVKDDQLRDVCIYTTKKKADLISAIHGCGKDTYSIKTRMVSAVSLLERCKRRGLALPIIISDAAICMNLIAHGFLTSVVVGEGGTNYTFENLKRIRGSHKLSDLRLVSSGKNISEDYIRPYAICYRPLFILRPA